MPNTFAYIMLCLWPLVSVFLFLRLSLTRAVIWTILGGYLVLPPTAHFNLQVLPDLDKTTISNICAYVGFVATRKQSLGAPKSFLFHLLLGLFLFTSIGTVFTNLDPIYFGIGGLHPMTWTEVPAIVLTNLTIALPVLVGYQVFRDEQSMRDLLFALMTAGLVYSIPMLVEIRFSPQINVWVYGFFQHAFDQMMRYGGFRPIVFLPHGLWMAFFAFMAAFAAIALLLIEPEKRRMGYLICGYLVVVLILCKSASAITYIVLFVPLLLFLNAKVQVRIAAVIAAVVLCYPTLRGSGLIPTAVISEFAASIDGERAASLIFRLVNEDALLAHANERPWFGWGGWGRNLIHHAATGRLASTIDGHWIVTFGLSGWFGYLGQFGLITLGVLMLAFKTNLRNASDYRYTAAVALILAANLIDLIPNATLIPFTWLLAGAVLGRVDAMGTVRTTVAKLQADPPTAAPWGRQRRPG